MSAKSIGSRRNPRRASRSGVALTGSITVHALIGLLAIAWPADSHGPLPPVYAVQLVAAPIPEPDQRPAPEVIERVVEPPPPEVPTPTPEPVDEAPTAPVPDDPVENTEPAPRTAPEEPPAEDVEPSTGTAPVTVDTPGLEFQYPGYLRNIITQIYRRWSRPQGNQSHRAEVLFFIRPDGSVSNFQFTQRSGNLAFDLRAQGAVEAASNAKAFGPLPEGYPNDVLPVSFFFDPSTLAERR